MSDYRCQTPNFALLPKAKTPWTEFVFSTGIQAAIIAVLAWTGLMYPAVISSPERSYISVQLVSTPVEVRHDPQPMKQFPRPSFTATLESPTDALRLSTPKPKTAEKIPDPAPDVQITSRKIDLPPNPVPVLPKQAVKTNVFSTGTSAAPSVALAPSEVQTGGFGDPNGLSARAGTGRPANVAALGSFDMPSAAGSGNGSGGAKGASGVVASAGFGNSPARPAVHARGIVQQSGFTDVDVPAASVVHSSSAQASTNVAPAEILSKPTPSYTQEARNLRIEGEVLLEVLLQSTGTLRVLRVVRGLGHGLDDNAVKAAEQIHFKPAIRAGQPADSTVVLHIFFQLA